MRFPLGLSEGPYAMLFQRKPLRELYLCDRHKWNTLKSSHQRITIRSLCRSSKGPKAHLPHLCFSCLGDISCLPWCVVAVLCSTQCVVGSTSLCFSLNYIQMASFVEISMAKNSVKHVGATLKLPNYSHRDIFVNSELET